MSKIIDDGGPAFPGPMAPGLTIRDLIAIAILHARCGMNIRIDPKDHAAGAYMVADAMIAARKL